MIDRDRLELLSLIEALSSAHPAYRLGQLIANLLFLANEESLYDITDRALIEAARKHLADLEDQGGAESAAAAGAAGRTPT